MSSLQQRIGLSLTLSLSLCFCALALLADYGVQKLQRDFISSRLAHDADNLLNALQRDRNQQWILNEQKIAQIYQRVQSGHYFQIQTADSKIRSRSLWDRNPALVALPSGVQRLDLQRAGDEHWLIWQQGFSLDGQSLTLWVAEDIAPIERQWAHFSHWLYTAMAVALIALVGLQYGLLRWGFRQIARIGLAIRDLRRGEIAKLSPHVDREIQPLTMEINHLLERQEQRISRSRTATGNLAHEIKRELQLLNQLTDALPEHSGDSFRASLARIRQLTERELRRSRIAGSPSPGRRFQPDQDLPHLLAVLRRIYPQLQLRYQGLTGAETLPYDRDDMLELLGNLLDNACKYGHSAVDIALGSDARHYWFDISDDGPGIAAEHYTLIAQRGQRIDERIDGHGLGLAICQMIVESYHGQLQFCAAAPQGLRVRASLPREPA